MPTLWYDLQATWTTGHEFGRGQSQASNGRRPLKPWFCQQSLSEQSKIISFVTSLATFLQKSCSKKLFCLKKFAIWPKPVHRPFIKNCSNVIRKILIRLSLHRLLWPLEVEERQVKQRPLQVARSYWKVFVSTISFVFCDHFEKL